MSKAIISLLLMVVVGCTSCNSHQEQPSEQKQALEIYHSNETYNSNGQNISIEKFAPKQQGKYPTLILAHGADGLKLEKWTKIYSRLSEELAQNGYIVFLPHYFESTQTEIANFPTIVKNFAVWGKTIENAIDYAVNQPNIDSSKVGVVGVSLGASEVLTLATQDRRIVVVVEFFGAMPDWAWNLRQRMSPTLILHGEADSIVSVKEAYKLDSLLKEASVPHKVNIYPNQNHGFVGKADQDSKDQAVMFLNSYLK